MNDERTGTNEGSCAYNHGGIRLNGQQLRMMAGILCGLANQAH